MSRRQAEHGPCGERLACRGLRELNLQPRARERVRADDATQLRGANRGGEERLGGRNGERCLLGRKELEGRADEVGGISNSEQDTTGERHVPAYLIGCRVPSSLGIGALNNNKFAAHHDEECNRGAWARAIQGAGDVRSRNSSWCAACLRALVHVTAAHHGVSSAAVLQITTADAAASESGTSLGRIWDVGNGAAWPRALVCDTAAGDAHLIPNVAGSCAGQRVCDAAKDACWLHGAQAASPA